MSKQELELFIIDTFKELYTAFPEGELVQGESPDFEIFAQDKTIGIEIAEVFQDSHLYTGSQLKQLEKTEDKFEKALLNELQNKTDKHFILGVDFNTHLKIIVNNINHLVKACLPQCLEFLWNNQLNDHIRIYRHPLIKRFPLPDEINSIYLQILKKDIPSFNTQSQGGGVANLEYKHIEPAILKHQKAKAKYKQCDEYWLLLREGNYYAGSFQKVDIKIPIQSTFDKVFIVRTRNREVIEIKS